MSWPCTCIDGRAGLARLACALLLSSAVPAAAQGVERAIMPGPAIEGHAKLEADCANCHVRFDRAAQSRLCMDCHKAVAGDVRTKAGYHGRIAERECRSCHTEHKGRGAKIVALEPAAFDHAQTDFALRGRHRGASCAGCHRPGTKHRDAPHECSNCHRKDDRHEGNLGPKCENCHAEPGWKDARFDHAKTRFPLHHRHAQIKCAECHADPRHAGTPRECASCHRKDDAHKGSFGARCEECHADEQWKAPSFRHDRDTRFALRERHRAVRCESCHRAPLHGDRLSTACVACHRKDDPHREALGAKCETCHAEKGWRSLAFEHRRDTGFELRGKHRQVARCGECHKSAFFRDKTDARCVACHEKDDKHAGELGRDCAACHTESGWPGTAFDHGKARFPLLGAHAKVACRNCHATTLFRDTKSDCVACHRKDDFHKERLGLRCVECHTPESWKKPGFDHNARSRFKLEGLHVKVRCHACHVDPMKEKIALATDCVSCHRWDDAHQGGYGTKCEECHVSEGWRKVTNRNPPGGRR